MTRLVSIRLLAILLLATFTLAAAAQTMLPPPIVLGRDQLAHKDFLAAKETFANYAKTNPSNALAAMGEGDADLGLHRLDDAELAYRRAVMIEPELWIAHKDLVLVEAELGRWGEFDRERALLRGARERGAPNITMRESDEIDSFTINGKRWLVREYTQPVGRSETRYNFEHFSTAGRVEEYISLEPAAAAKAALSRVPQVKIGADATHPITPKVWALNWYTDRGHGTIKTYHAGEPTYEAVRADVRRWLLAKR